MSTKCAKKSALMPQFAAWARSLSLTTYCVIAGAAAFTGAVVMVGAVYLVSKALGLDFMLRDPGPTYRGLVDMFGILVFAPVVETFVLAGFLKLLLSWDLSPVRACVISAVGWGLMHGVNTPMAVFGPTWGFLLFGAGYLLWRPVSFRHAFAAAAVPHALNNAAAALVGRLWEISSSAV